MKGKAHLDDEFTQSDASAAALHLTPTLRLITEPGKVINHTSGSLFDMHDSLWLVIVDQRGNPQTSLFIHTHLMVLTSFKDLSPVLGQFVEIQ